MRLRTALNEFKRDRGGRRAGERALGAGAFSGHGDRLVHVGRSGAIRDFSAALSGLFGIDRSRFGIETATGTEWLDDLETIRQHYYRETSLVETEYDAGAFTVHQYDLTLGRAHVTHFELRGEIPPEARLIAYVSFAPEGQETRVGRLIHEDGGPAGTRAVEVFHRREHDFLTASTGIDDVRGQIPERFSEILDDQPIDFPRTAALNRYEDTHLSGDVVVTAPFDRVGRGSHTTFLTQVSDRGEVDRDQALEDLQACAKRHRDVESIRNAASERTALAVPEDLSRPKTIRSDLRALELLESPTGAHVAAPEFDPFFVDSGGYGYTWFRDEAESARALLETSERAGIEVRDTIRSTVRFFCDTQLADGTWPHRVWAVDGTLAPGWANANVEKDSDSTEYQADQTASVTVFLAATLREREDRLPRELADRMRGTIADGVAALVDSLDDRGLPKRCQNAWEDATGQFTHTTATYLHAFAAVARAPIDEDTTSRAQVSAWTVYEALDLLWNPDRGAYLMRLSEDHPDDRLDAATFALVDAFLEFASVEDESLTETDLDRLTEHVSTTLDGLHRNPTHSDAAGLVRYEDDAWRRDEQADAKLWSVATAWGAVAAAKLGVMLEGHGRNGEGFLTRATSLYDLLEPDGPFCTDVGYLAEQIYDDGTLDSAAPLGWSHALRLQATTILDDQEALPTATTPEGPPERPRWTTGEKFGLSTVADHGSADPSRVWFTLTEGALTECRFPRVDLMNLRTLDFLVTARDEDYSVRTHEEVGAGPNGTVERRVEPAADDALLFEHVITEPGDGRGHEWELRVEYAPDPEHDAIVADVSFRAKDEGEYAVYAVADVALTNAGTEHRGMRTGQPGSYHLLARDIAAYTGESTDPLLTDENDQGYSVAMAMTATTRFDWATVDTAGSPALSDLFASGEAPSTNDRIDDENLVMVGRLGVGSTVGETLALGFARSADTAAALGEAAGALDRGYDTVCREYVTTWQDFLAEKPIPDAVAGDEKLANQYRTALMSLLAVEDKTFLGASIASPSVPWGQAVSAEEPRGYGYNFVWSRDLYQIFTVFLAVDDLERAVDQLEYIYRVQQDEAGFIPQNTYINGRTRWGGEQMDNISFPQVMAYQLWDAGVEFDDVEYGYANVRRSADYVAMNGPETAQERWEEEAGYSPSSIAAEIAGLVSAATIAIDVGKDADALVWLALADQWTNRVEEWTATETGSDRHDETPYFLRVTRDGDPDAGHLRTLANAGPTLDERDVIDAGFLELVRLGIKPATDDVVQNSLVETDETIRVDVPREGAAAFYRYNGDGYGERASGDQGAPWSLEHHGKGRLWPILSGERGEYELVAEDAGTDLDPTALLEAIAGFANSGRMIAEQVWDREYGTDYGWEFGEGTGSATPLAWSMTQFVRLALSIDAEAPVETPACVEERYREREIHQQDRGPALRVDTSFAGDTIVVRGETTGEIVAVKSPAETVLVEPTDGAFEHHVAVDPGENQLVVAAATNDDLEAASTTVTRLTL